MAHSTEKQAQVWALLMLGNTPRYVSQQTGVPLTTVRRWKPAAMAYLRECMQEYYKGHPIKMALKKELE